MSDPAPLPPQYLLGHWFLSRSLPQIFISDLLLSLDFEDAPQTGVEECLDLSLHRLCCPPYLTSVKQDWLHIGVEDAEFGSHADSSRCPDAFEHDESCSCLADSAFDVSDCASLLVTHTSQVDERLHLSYGLSTNCDWCVGSCVHLDLYQISSFLSPSYAFSTNVLQPDFLQLTQRPYLSRNPFSASGCLRMVCMSVRSWFLPAFLCLLVPFPQTAYILSVVVICPHTHTYLVSLCSAHTPTLTWCLCVLPTHPPLPGVCVLPTHPPSPGVSVFCPYTHPHLVSLCSAHTPTLVFCKHTHPYRVSVFCPHTYPYRVSLCSAHTPTPVFCPHTHPYRVSLCSAHTPTLTGCLCSAHIPTLTWCLCVLPTHPPLPGVSVFCPHTHPYLVSRCDLSLYLLEPESNFPTPRQESCWWLAIFYDHSKSDG